MAEHTQLTFAGYDCVVRWGQYGNGRTAIHLAEAETDDPVAIATINLPDEPLAADEVVIKNYSENTGMLSVLVAAGIVAAPHRQVPCGWVLAPVCRLVQDAAVPS